MSVYNKINDYLYFGYLPPNELPPGLEIFNREIPGEWKYNAEDCSRLLGRVFDDTLANSGSFSRVVIPISGGWDSRILLGLALEHFPSADIKTYTFGQPGQYDYDIGATIAKKMGVEHIGINLNEVAVEWNVLKTSVKLSRWTYVPDSFFNQLGYKMMAKSGDGILNGFMGDPLTGSHFVENGLTCEQILEDFVRKQKKADSFDLTQSEYEPSSSIPAVTGNHLFEKSEHLDFGVRQFHCIVRIISQMNSLEGWKSDLGKTEAGAHILTPFSHPMWAKYWSGAPEKAKKDRALYVEMMKSRFPKLSALPSKNYYGASSGSGIFHYLMKKRFNLRIVLHQHFPAIFRKQIKSLNYLDFQEAFIRRDDYRALWEKGVQFLTKNDSAPWIEFDRLMKEHESGQKDHSWALLTIIGLALNLEVEQSEEENS